MRITKFASFETNLSYSPRSSERFLDSITPQMTAVPGLPATPQAAEKLADAKATLTQAIQEVRGRRRVYSTIELLPFIAQEQRLPRLRQLASFRRFESDLISALQSLSCIN
ncbi:MAG: hypothetical protein ACJ8D6_05190 [Sphingomicrobium sp.]